MKKISLIKEKYAQERAHLLSEMKQQEEELKQLRASNEGQLRLIQNVTGHIKNGGGLPKDDSQSGGLTALEKVSEES